MTQPLRVLLVEDRPADAELIVAQLRASGYEVVWTRVERKHEFAQALFEPYDVILCDYTMPEMDALEALEIWREHDGDTPFLVVSGSIGEELAVEAMQAGAWDYLLKDRLVRLGRAVQRCLERRDERRMHRETQRILQLHQRAVEASTQGFIMVDAQLPDLPIIYVNSAFTRITGYAPEEALGRNCRFLQGPETDTDATKRLREAVRDGRPCAVELLNYRKDGIPFWNHLTISPVHDDQNRITHFVGIQTDVSERKSLERQLLQSQKMEAVGRLAGGIAHDFNNLLTIILGYSELLLELDPTPEQYQLVQQIREAGERAVALTRQLLMFSRRDSATPDVFDLNDVTGKLEQMLRRIIGEDIELRTDVTPVACQIKADPSRVEQVILNLAINARDAMPGGGTLTIRTRFLEAHPESYEPGWVLLSVADTGCGMTEEIKARIFEPFFTTKAMDKGTGLGLSTVFGVVNESGGQIRVDSAPAQGTTFDILWPAAEPELTTDSIHHGEPPLPGGEETILFVEPDEQARTMGKLVLESVGYRVLEVTGAWEAVQRSVHYEGPIDLLVADMVMPDMTGRQLADSIVGQRPHLRALFVSGMADEPTLNPEQTGEFVPLLRKPYTSVTLAKKVREVLDHSP